MEQLFPKDLREGYQGHVVARYVFYLITIVTIGRSLIHMFAADGGAQSIATILVGRMKPIVLLGTAPGAVGNYVFVPILLVMLMLSTQRNRTAV